MKTYLLILFLAMSTTLFAQKEMAKWEFGGGLRLNYLGLSGGYEGLRYSDNYSFKMNYKDIGMDNYSPSMAIAFGGRYKKWNLAFAGSRGSYDGEFTTNMDIIRDDIEIPSGSEVKGKIDMGIYALTTTYAFIQKKHDLGAGIGFLILNMGSNFSTTDVNENPISLGEPATFPMPFLAIAGRLNFGKIRFTGSGGGAIFNGKKDGLDYDVKYYTIDIKGVYDFYKGDNWTYNVGIGYRKLFMDMYMKNDLGWAKETDHYSGPYFAIRAKFSSTEKWTYVKRKDRMKNNNY